MNELRSTWPPRTAVLFLCALGIAARSWGQAPSIRATPPTSSGFELPRATGTLTYSVALSEGVALGYNGTNATEASTNVSGHLAFLSTSVRQPTSLVLSAGYLFPTSGEPGNFFESLGVSQVFNVGRFNIVVSDGLNYLPANPVSGLSGVAGLGDQGLAPVQVGQSDGSQLLSGYSPRINNAVSGSVSYALTNITSVSGSGSYTILRTLGSGTGVDNTGKTAGFGVSHRLNELSSVSGNYSYSQSSYTSFPEVYTSQGATIGYSRQWSQKLFTDFAIGPQYSSGSTPASLGLPPTPSTLNYSLTASSSYSIGRVGLAASVVRATNSGSGITLASRSTSSTASATRRVGNFGSASANLSYSHNVTLPSPLLAQTTNNALVGSVQYSRSLSRTLSAYGSYTLQHQLAAQNAFVVNAFNGTTQSFGFGVTFSPAPYILGK